MSYQTIVAHMLKQRSRRSRQAVFTLTTLVRSTRTGSACASPACGSACSAAGWLNTKRMCTANRLIEVV